MLNKKRALMYGIALNNNNNPVVMRLKTEMTEDVSTNHFIEDATSELKQIYRQAPTTSCNKCGNCCKTIGTPDVFSVEYLNMVKFLNTPENKSIKKKIYGIALMSKALLEKKMKEDPKGLEYDNFSTYCPAQDPETGLCLVYRHRPLECRLFGLDRWHKGPDGWERQPGKQQCDNVQISEDDQSEYWTRSIKRSLNKRLSRISRFYYINKTSGKILNVNSMQEWLTLKPTGVQPG